MLFIIVLPLGILSFFVPKIATEAIQWHAWLTIPLSMIVQWVFFTMEKIGDYSENPFEGIGNDVPITAMSRGIEIDLRDMLEEKELPENIKPWNGAILT
jgi:putative membrane protein